MSTTLKPDAPWECNENKFQFNWTATKIQVCKDLRNGGLKVVSAVQWETYCRRIDAADYKMFETRLNQNFRNVLLHDRSLWSRPNTTVSKRSNFRVFHFGSDAKRFGKLCDMSVKQACIIGKSQTFLQALPHECETSLSKWEKWQGPGTVNVWRWKSCLYIQRC